MTDRVPAWTGHHLRPAIPARCRLCSSPASARSDLCEAHHERALDMRDEERDE